MRIFDAFCYNGEKRLIQIRVEEMNQLRSPFVEVIHVAVESTYTFTGIKKSFDDVHPEVDRHLELSSPMESAWANESKLRNFIRVAIETHKPEPDDIVIISDADEIPRSYAIQHYKSEMGMMALQMDVFQFYLNTRAQRQSWVSPRIMPWSYLKDKTPEEVRRSGFNFCLYGGGWHMTYMGGIEAIQTKFASFSHQEREVQVFNNKALLEDRIKNLKYLWEDYPLEIVGDSELPFYLTRNKDEFKDMLYV